MKKLAIFGFLTLFLLITLGIADRAITQDLGRHLMMGRVILSCHCVPVTNLFSFTNPTFPFIDHHWLSEVVFFLLQQAGGFGLIMWIKVVIILLSFGLVLWIALKQSRSFWVFSFGVFYVMMFSERFDTRPEVFSFLFLSLFIFLIDRYRRSRSFYPLLALPFIQVLWSNMHIYFPIGVGLFIYLLIDQFVVKRRLIDKRLFVVFILLIGSLFINPHGLTGALYPFHVFDHYGYSIVENQNVFFLNTFFFNYHILIFEVLALLFVLSLVVNFRKLDVFYTLAGLSTMIAAFTMIRNFPLFVLVSFPYITFLYSEFFKRISANMEKKTIRFLRFLLVGWSSVFLLIASFFYFSTPLYGFHYIPDSESGVEFLKKQVPGQIFNNFDVGSFLIYHLYPERKVFVDGRPEAYPVSFFEMYKKMQEDPVVFEREAQRYHLNAIYFATTDITPWAQQFLGWIGNDTHWVPVYLDEKTVIFVRNNRQNQAIIAKFRINPLR